ncbi:MAG: FAD-binding oxidoreductase [Gammaproteobacteria bacterium]|nr:FAD-binding oxidoreductase [Gammaproteobacteria bacterium]
MALQRQYDVAIIGAGIAGIATAYYVLQRDPAVRLVLIDAREPMSYTSAQSGNNYRDWWPRSEMTALCERSIDLMADIAEQTDNAIHMQRLGYALATRRDNIQEQLQGLTNSYRTQPHNIRLHERSPANAYIDSLQGDWQSDISGVDVLSDPAIIRQAFPAFSKEIKHVMHIRRAGDIDGQQLGQFMLQAIKAAGGQRLRGRVQEIRRDKGYQLLVTTQQEAVKVNCERMVNAAGPMAGDIAGMLGIQLPIHNIYQQKITFEDTLGAVPREQAFAIDIDPIKLPWSDEESVMLKQDPQLAWLSEQQIGGIHCRPDGSGRWIKLGWAFNRNRSEPNTDYEFQDNPDHNEYFPEIVLRAAARLTPALQPYYENLPSKLVHYGGYYSMTDENWPLIGPLDEHGAYMVAALSGFGTMAACAAAELCTAWLYQDTLPQYAEPFSLRRYKNAALMAELRAASDVGLL